MPATNCSSARYDSAAPSGDSQAQRTTTARTTPATRFVAGPAADTRLAHQRCRSRPGSTSTAPPGSGMPPIASRISGMTTL